LGGVAKGLERVGGVRIIDRVARCLREVTPDLLLVANDPDAAHWLENVPVIRDRYPGKGGLAGVEAALRIGGGRDALVLAWDMPFVTAPVLRALIDLARSHDAEAALPSSDSPYGFEPFCGYYAGRILPRLTRYLDEAGGGGGAARDFVAQLEHVPLLGIAETAMLGDPKAIFLSVNTPDDLERARAIAAQTE
jgi:molybdopterin-guanine dinucleotide biosynthesis protein A